MHQRPENLIDLPEYRHRQGIFFDRLHAGRVLADMLAHRLEPESAVLAVPAGGVPVACALAQALGLDVGVVVVSKITFPWNSEAGYGAVAENGLVRLNDRILARVQLSATEIEEGIAATTAKVMRRVKAFRGDHPAPDIRRRPVILVDDGLASGTTLQVAMEAVVQLEAGAITLAVPTGYLDSIRRIAGKAAWVCCANVRSGSRFAVADAYQHWSDLAEPAAVDMFRRHRQRA